MFAIPSAVLVGTFFVVPFFLNLRFAFTSWSGFTDVINWIGLDNFELLLKQNILVPAVRVTVTYALTAMVLQNLISLTLALALQSTNRINTIFRSIFFIPVLFAAVAAGYIWAAILSPDGTLNDVIAIFVPGFDYAWLGHPETAIYAVAFIDAWKWSGIVTLVYIAGLNSIPRSLIDAAIIDGASAWQRFWRVKFRLLAPAFTFNVAVTLLGAMSAFDIPVSATNGGPGNETTVLNIAMYRQWTGGFFGSASALSLMVTIIVVLTAIPLIAWLRRREVET